MRPPGFGANVDIRTNLTELEGRLTRGLAKHPGSYGLDRFEVEGVPAGRVIRIAEVLADPHVADRGMVTSVEHPTAGEVRTLGLPVRFSRTPGSVSRPSPLYGQHNAEVLAEFGFSPDEISQFETDGAVSSLKNSK